MQPQEVKEGKIDNVEHTNDEVKENQVSGNPGKGPDSY